MLISCNLVFVVTMTLGFIVIVMSMVENSNSIKVTYVVSKYLMGNCKLINSLYHFNYRLLN